VQECLEKKGFFAAGQQEGEITHTLGLIVIG
jgi:hypothetical protein